MPIESRSSDTECFDNIRDERIVFCILEHGLRRPLLFISHDRWFATDPAFFLTDFKPAFVFSTIISQMHKDSSMCAQAAALFTPIRAIV